MQTNKLDSQHNNSASSLGRSCTRHVACGQVLEVSDIIRFKQEVMLVDEEVGAAGGEGRAPIGRTRPLTPWGKPALGIKTRKNKKLSSAYIVRRRS